MSVSCFVFVIDFHIRQLHLQNNRFVSLPSSLGSFKFLQSLILDHNLLVSIPASLMLCSSLQVLSFFNDVFLFISRKGARASAQPNLAPSHLYVEAAEPLES